MHVFVPVWLGTTWIDPCYSLGARAGAGTALALGRRLRLADELLEAHVLKMPAPAFAVGSHTRTMMTHEHT